MRLVFYICCSHNPGEVDSNSWDVLLVLVRGLYVIWHMYDIAVPGKRSWKLFRARTVSFDWPATVFRLRDASSGTIESLNIEMVFLVSLSQPDVKIRFISLCRWQIRSWVRSSSLISNYGDRQ